MNKQNDSFFGNPRFLLVLAITFIGMWGWQYYLNQKYPPAQTAVSAVTTSSDTTNSLPPANVSSPNPGVPGAAVKPVEAQSVNFDYSDEAVEFTITSAGFGFTNFQMKDYKDHEEHNIQFFTGNSLFRILHNGELVPFTIVTSSDKLTYTGEAVIDGKNVKRVLTYNKDNRSFTSVLSTPEGLQKLEFDLTQKKYVPKTTNFLMPSFEYQDFVYTNNGKTHSERISSVKAGEGLINTHDNVTMASIGSQYFVTAFINKSDVNPRIVNKVEGDYAHTQIQYDLATTKVGELKHIYYLGAKKTEILQTIDPVLPDVLNYGIFGFISKLLLVGMKFIHSFVGNWGVAIIILTVIVRTLLLPFNIMSFRSAQAMQKIKPKMDAIREKYKSDPMRLNKETMALMKENNANPISGCLPMLLQIPIFFAFFATISTSVELYHQPFLGWIHDLSKYDPYFVLPVLMGLTMYFQQKLTPTTMDPMQAKILNFMPIIFTFFMITLPSGLTLYNFVSALFGVVQQYFLLKDSKQVKTS